jgi:hypothetical protein
MTMPRTERSTVVGVFHEREQAREAIEALKDAGFAPDAISILSPDKQATQDMAEQTGTQAGSGAATGAVAGGILGGLGGWLVGIGALAIPGIGPVVAGGALASALGVAGGTAAAGAGIGAVTGGIVGALVGLGIPEEEARYHEQGFRSGRTLVTVNAGAGRAGEAADILRSYDGDIGPAATRTSSTSTTSTTGTTGTMRTAS